MRFPRVWTLLGVGEAACAEEVTQQSVLWKNLFVWEIWNSIRTEREREEQRMSILTIVQQLQNDNNHNLY